MANTRIKDLTNTATTVPSDAYVAIDGSANGTAKISRDDLRQDTADAIAAAPSTYNLAPLTSGSVDVDKGGTGSTTVAGAKTNLEVPNVGTAPNEVSLNGMLNSGAWLDFDAFYETGTWTPTVSFGGGSTGLTTSSSYGHYLKVGSLCYAYGRMVLTSKGTSIGNAELSLPLTAANREDGYQGGMIVEAANLTSLTSSPSLRINDNVATGTLKHWSTTGTGNLTNANFTDTTIISYAATYQIA